MKKQYRDLISKHRLFTPVISELIKSLLISEKIKFHIVEHRTKEPHSFEQKIVRKKIQEANDITDITGIRIILYYQDDVDRVDELLRVNFLIDEDNSIDKAEILESNEFGYLSVHYIIQLDKKRNELPEWKNYSRLKAEVQVRTVLQHSWASISPEMSYKRTIEIPKVLSRKLFRLAGLFELADEQFLTIRDEHSQLEIKIEELSASNKLNDEEINTLTLKKAASKKDSVFQTIEQLADDAGFMVLDEEDSVPIPSIILLANIMDLNSIGDLEKLLESNISLIKILFNTIIERGDWEGSLYFFIELALLLSLGTEQKNAHLNKLTGTWDEDLWNEVNSYIQEIKNRSK